jgi:hypothetical protein
MKTAVVAGDVMEDWNLAIPQAEASAERSWAAAGSVHRSCQPGGAALLADLVREAAAAIPGWTVAAASGEVGAHRTYTLLSPAKDVWRVEKFLGVELAHGGATRKAVDTDAELVVLLDADMGFRDTPAEWPKALTDPAGAPWVILKTCASSVDGPLWNHLLDHHADRLIVVTTIDDLRRMEIQISRRLSWERAAQDLVWELRRNPAINNLSRCRHAIVSFGTAGAVLLSGPDRGASLVFDPSLMEGEWESPRSGSAIGYTVTLATAVAAELMQQDSPNVERAIQSGVAGMRALFKNGYGAVNPDVITLAFPTAAVVKELLDANARTLTVHPIRQPEERMEADGTTTRPWWTILDDRLKAQPPDALAESVALLGPEVTLSGIPQGKIGGFFTVDRREIESLHSIKSLLAEYVKRRPSKPLSIAVFGPPGSGKSFGVEQVAKSVGQDDIQVRTFNLSQLAHPEDLYGALHQVRDISLRGKVPVVFWDEFDTPLDRQPLGWLRYFLAPMQDGEFQEAQITHPIGTSVFVFAGGTADRFDQFGAKLREKERKNAKVPDFVSRLKGFLDVMGPNRRGDVDPYFRIRRAVLLRSLLQRHCPLLFEGKQQVLQIDPGVLRAFLQTGEYKHGARSLEAVIMMSALAGKKKFERSSLPPEAQLDLHVNGSQFIRLVQELQLSKEVLESLAEAAHDVFCKGKVRDGWSYGPEKDAQKKTHPLLVPYAQLPEWAKEANRVTVKSIPRKLAAIGYAMMHARSGLIGADLSSEIEYLAQVEHLIWIEAKIADGFVRGKPTAENPKQNEYLVPWAELPEEIRQIDRDLVRAIPEILAAAGYTIVKV